MLGKIRINVRFLKSQESVRQFGSLLFVELLVEVIVSHFFLKPPDKCVCLKINFLNPQQTCVVGTQKNRLNETLLLITHNTLFN